MPGPEHDFASESDDDLLVYMAWRHEDAEHAAGACSELFKRHRAFLITVVRNAYRDVLGEEGVEDVVMGTFLRAIEGASTYQPRGAGDPEAARRNVRAWLGQIAKNVAMDVFREPDARIPLAPADLPDNIPAPLTLPSGQTREEECVRDVLESLPERERCVALVTAQHSDGSAGPQRLPNGVAADLARAFNTTPENIRQIRKRVFAKIKAAVESLPKHQPVRSPV